MLAKYECLKLATRFVTFLTGDPDFAIATSGGTLLLVEWEGRPYGLTARHNVHSFEWQNLIVTDRKDGNEPAGLRSIHYIGSPTGANNLAEISDLAVICFDQTTEVSFFGKHIYPINDGSVDESKSGDSLIVYGAVSEMSGIEQNDIYAMFGELGFKDDGPSRFDPSLRQAAAQWTELQMSDLAGISGGPVFNVTRQALCGMIVRGSITGPNHALAHYIDIPDIVRVLYSTHNLNG